MTAAAAMDWFNSRPERPGHEVMADRFHLIADKIHADPSLLDRAIATIDRWLGVSRASERRLEQWRAVILDAKNNAAGMTKLLSLLRDQSADAVFFKEFAPFTGILSHEELARLSWTSAH